MMNTTIQQKSTPSPARGQHVRQVELCYYDAINMGSIKLRFDKTRWGDEEINYQERAHPWEDWLSSSHWFRLEEYRGDHPNPQATTASETRQRD